MEAALLERPAEVQPLGVSMEDVRTAALGHMRGHVFEGCQQEQEKLLVGHGVVLDFLSVSGFIGHIVGRVGYHQIGLNAIHEQVNGIRISAVPAHHAVSSQRPDVARLHIGRKLVRVDIAVVVMNILVMHLAEQVIHLGGVKARRPQVITGKLQVLQKLRQGHRLPVARGLVERDVQGFFIRRVLDVHHNAVHLSRSFSLQHLVALVTADDVARHLVPDDGIDIPKVVQAALDFLIRRVAGLQVFPGVVLRGLQHLNRHRPHVQIRIHRLPPIQETSQDNSQDKNG